MRFSIALLLPVLLALNSCHEAPPPATDQPPAAPTPEPTAGIPAHDTTVRVLGREQRYDTAAHDSVSTIVINDAFCRSLPDRSRAALGYVATFTGSECWWDGDDANDARSNLKCKLLTALGLGYQCSERHLGFLRQWFRGDAAALKALENCPTTPYTATVQETFDAIDLTVRADSSLIVRYDGSGLNMRAGTSWSWQQADTFRTDGSTLRLAGSKRSEVKASSF